MHVLLIAFHFPPLHASSGLQRPLALARYLHEYGWEPSVLTARPLAYESVDPGSAATIPSEVPVVRAAALDAARHLSIRGWYPGWLGIPDRWTTWFIGALPAGLGLIRRVRPKLIWSTYPLATAHLIGYALHRLSGVPWMADFRDPMVEQLDGEWFPDSARLRRARLWVERLVSRHAAAVTFCTESARRIYIGRYPERKAGQVVEVIANGFDPEPFAAVEEEMANASASRSAARKITLVHSGTLYPGPDRDPGAFFEALCRLRARGILPANLQVILRATAFDHAYQPVIDEMDLAGVVQLAPAVNYRAALREMLDADGLLLFQGRTSNPAVPAKVYEYLRARRPILALAHAAGETAALLQRAGTGRLLPIDEAAAIEAGLEAFLQGIAAGSESVLSPREADQFSRRHRAAEFAALFTRVVRP